MISQINNKYDIRISLIKSNKSIELTSDMIGEYFVSKSPLKRKETVHIISFLDAKDEILNQLEEKENGEIVYIKINIYNITTKKTILNNVLRLVSIENLKEGPGYTYSFNLLCVGLIGYECKRNNILSQLTSSGEETEPIKKIIVYDLMELCKTKLETYHGNSFQVELTNSNSASQFVYEYIKIPSSIRDIDAFEYLDKQYQGFFFPQFYFVDDMPLNISNSNKTTIMRQLDLGFLDQYNKIDIYSEENFNNFNNSRKFPKSNKPFLDSYSMNKELNQTYHILKNTEIDEIKVVKPNEDNIGLRKKINLSDDKIILSDELITNYDQKNHNIINSFDEFDIHQQAKNIFRNGGGNPDLIPQLERWEFHDTCPFYLNFGNLYNVTEKDKYDHFPIDINYRFSKELNEREHFFVSTDISFYVSNRTNLLSNLLN